MPERDRPTNNEGAHCDGLRGASPAAPQTGEGAADDEMVPLNAGGKIFGYVPRSTLEAARASPLARRLRERLSQFDWRE